MSPKVGQQFSKVGTVQRYRDRDASNEAISDEENVGAGVQKLIVDIAVALFHHNEQYEENKCVVPATFRSNTDNNLAPV